MAITDEIKFLLRHSAIYGIGNFMSRAVAFVLLPLYTRYLTPTDYGVLELIDVTTGLIGIVVGLGVATSMARFYYDPIDDAERGRVISTIYILALVLSSALVLAAFASARAFARLVLDDAAYTHHFYVAFGSLLLGLFVDIGQSYLRLLYKSMEFIILSTATLVLGVALNVFFIVYLGQGVLGMLYGALITRIVVVVPLTGWILRRTGVGFSAKYARSVLVYSLPLIPSTVATAVVNYADRYLVKHFLSIADAGVYGVANKLGSVMHYMITSPFIMTFLPRRFEIAHRADATDVFRAVFDCFVFVLLFLSLAMAIFIDEIMMLMTAPAFWPAGNYVPVMLLAMLVYGLKYMFEFGIMYADRTKYYFYINTATSAAYLVAAYLFIRSFGLWGAVVATLFGYAANAAALHVVSSRFYPVPYNFGRAAKLLLLAAVAYGVSRLVGGAPLPIAVAVKFVILIAAVAIPFASGIIPPAEARQIRMLAMRSMRTQTA